MANSADPDQLASDLDLHCLQRQDISGFSRTRVKRRFQYSEIYIITKFVIVSSVSIKRVDC